MPRPKKFTLENEIEQAKRRRIDAALAAGCDSVRQIAAHLGVGSSVAWRLLVQLGYRKPESGWKAKGGKSPCPPKNGK